MKAIRRVTDEQNKKIKGVIQQEKLLYPMIIREHHHSTKVALAGLSEERNPTVGKIIDTRKEKYQRRLEFCKKGNKRLY